MPSVSSGDSVKDAMESWPPRPKLVCEAARKGFRPADGSFRNWAGQSMLHMAVLANDTAATNLILRFGLEHDPNNEGAVTMEKDGTVVVKRAVAKKAFFKVFVFFFFLSFVCFLTFCDSLAIATRRASRPQRWR